MKILCLADEECKALWDYYTPGKLNEYDLMLSCGDLKAKYLDFLVTMGRCPLMYVPGNHDTEYEKQPPEGCDCIDGKLVTYKGLRILGMGGSRMYSKGANQYTERQMKWKLRKAELKIEKAGGVDIIVTHAAPRGCGDAEDYCHLGFEAFLPFLDKWQPKYLIHGHVHMSYGHNIPRQVQYGNTKIINACERYVLEIENEL